MGGSLARTERMLALAREANCEEGTKGEGREQGHMAASC